MRDFIIENYNGESAPSSVLHVARDQRERVLLFLRNHRQGPTYLGVADPLSM